MPHTEQNQIAQDQDEPISKLLPASEIRKQIALQKIRQGIPMPYSQTMWFAVTQMPYVYQFASGQIDSSATGDTVIVTGITNKVLFVTAITSYKVAGTTQAWRFEIDTGAAFATTRIISPTNTSDKEIQGQNYILEATERIVLNVTTAVAATTIDWTVSYIEIGHGTVWS